MLGLEAAGLPHFLAMRPLVNHFNSYNVQMSQSPPPTQTPTLNTQSVSHLGERELVAQRCHPQGPACQVL